MQVALGRHENRWANGDRSATDAQAAGHSCPDFTRFERPRKLTITASPRSIDKVPKALISSHCSRTPHFTLTQYLFELKSYSNIAIKSNVEANLPGPQEAGL